MNDNITKMKKKQKLRASYICECHKVIAYTSDMMFKIPGDMGESDDFVSEKNTNLHLGVATCFNEIVGIYKKRVLRSKHCSECGAILPETVGMAKTFKVCLLGQKGRGKTVFTLAMTDLFSSINRFPIAKKEGFSIELETFEADYEKMRLKMVEDFKSNKLPAPTPIMSKDIHLSYKASNEHLQACVNLLLYDYFGEIGNSTLRSSANVNYADTIFFFVDGKDLSNATEVSNTYEYLKNIILSMNRKIPFYILISKSDQLLDRTQRMERNSLTKKGDMYTSVHDNGFATKHYQVEEKRSLEYMDTKLLNMLHTNFGKHNVFCCMISCINDEHVYLGVETPILQFLARTGIYPYKEGEA